MLQHLKNEANRTFTENGAVTHATTYSDCLDLFATIGALRSSNEQEIINRFIRAYSENPDLALKTVFFARDVRGGEESFPGMPEVAGRECHAFC